jgi:metal-responsive CopG/Arc/MetJ family transcriptional regulator
MPRRRKRDRPPTGHDPILGVRVPAKIIKKIDQLAEALFTDRSNIVRRLLQEGVASKSWMLGKGKGKDVVHDYIAVVAARERAKAAKAAVASAAPANKLNAEIKAQREQEKATAIEKRALLKLEIGTDRQVRRLSDAKFDAAIATAKSAVDRALARSRNKGL